MSDVTDSLQNFFKPLTLAQKVLFGLLSIGILSVFIFLFYWAMRPDYALLFGSMTPQSAQTVVEDLDSQNIRYELAEGGTAILVPRARVHELRLKYASQGTMGRDYKGYELFDSNTLGMTDFMQRVNKKRALEGELARTINSIEQIDFSRVHLVLPERSPFQENRVEASASVIVNMKPRQRLRHAQIEGISALIAGSVEGLSENHITILDQNGNRLSEDIKDGSDLAASNAQMKVRKETENYLLQKGQSMLDQVLGPGNAILRVNTEHDFERLSRQSNLIDPDSRIVISEERRSDGNTDIRSQPIQIDEFTPPALRTETVTTSTRDQQSSVQVRNYEVNTTRENFEKPVGEVRRISASLLLNYKTVTEENDEGEMIATVVPYTNQELQQIRNVVRTALGIQLQRGDELEITQLEFRDPLADDPFAMVQYDQPVPYNEMLRWLLIIGAMGLAFALVYGLLKAMNPDKPLFFKIRPEVDGAKQDQKSFPRGEEDDDERRTGDGDDALRDTSTDDLYRRKLTPEAQRQLEAKSKMFEEIKNFSEFKSEETANLVRSMMVNKKGTEA